MIRPHEQTSYSLRFDGSTITAEETEFLLAMHAYQKRYHRRYPTWREVLLVAQALGYRKVAEPVRIDERLLLADEVKSEIRRPAPTAVPTENSPISSA